MAYQKRDNNTYRQKVLLRQVAMEHIGQPRVMETHGGVGMLFKACYAHLPMGVVFEKDPKRAEVLAMQRPTWAVYQADCVRSIKGGAGAHLAVDLLDVDPHGDPWPTIDAFFNSSRQYQDKMLVVVHDGLRQKLRLTGGWNVPHLAEFVERWGNDLFPIYLDVCREAMTEKAAQAGYSLDRWAGFHSGKGQGATHYLAILTR